MLVCSLSRFKEGALGTMERNAELGIMLRYSPIPGFGYATEAACAACDYGFNQLGLEQIVSFTVPDNQRSRKVMERLGMSHAPEDDFEHPLLPAGHPLRPHVLYRLVREAACRKSDL